jgi:acyl-CoA synthetase (NDP forming)
MDERRIIEIAGAAIAAGRSALTELEGMEVLEAMGLATPKRAFAAGAAEAAEASRSFPGEKVVIKVVSSSILHKTEVGGVAIVPNKPGEVKAAVSEMVRRLEGMAYEGFSLNELVSYEGALGREVIAGYRLAPDFGPVVSLGFGGIHAEFLAKSFRPGSATLVLSPATADPELAREALSRNALHAILEGGLRGTRKLLPPGSLAELAMAFVRAAPVLAQAGILEFEVNPFAVRPGAGGSGELVALDALAKVGPLPAGIVAREGRLSYPPQEARPTSKLEALLRPRSAAVIGVSEKSMNNGRIILRNLISNGLSPERVFVVKPGAAEIDGCACVPEVAALPEKVDLFVLVLPAAKAPGVLADLVEADKAQSIIVIPGGFEEKAGTEEITSRMRASLGRSRSGGDASGGGPIIVGGNCLGLLSVPGKYNTLFIPAHKLPRRSGASDPVALVSQSGAFAITRLSKHPLLAPEYVVTCGNQMDMTVGDFLEGLERDPSIKVFAVYVEGFRPLDGDKALRAVRRITSSGRTVIFYRAGRSEAGASAAASHTASIAGDYSVTRELFAQAGAVVAESLDGFDDALTAFTMLRDKERARRPGLPARLGVLSNAGFECVAAADNLGSLELASFSEATRERLAAAFSKAGIGDIVDVHNPLDLTPMAGDEAYEECFRAILDDPGVDCGVTGIVPLTAALNSLAEGPDYAGELMRKDGIVARYGRLMAETRKPWVAVVDSGRLYDPLDKALESRGVPVFRSVDRALAALSLWMGEARNPLQ